MRVGDVLIILFKPASRLSGRYRLLLHHGVPFGVTAGYGRGCLDCYFADILFKQEVPASFDTKRKKSQKK